MSAMKELLIGAVDEMLDAVREDLYVLAAQWLKEHDCDVPEAFDYYIGNVVWEYYEGNMFNRAKELGYDLDALGFEVIDAFFDTDCNTNGQRPTTHPDFIPPEEWFNSHFCLHAAQTLAVLNQTYYGDDDEIKMEVEDIVREATRISNLMGVKLEQIKPNFYELDIRGNKFWFSYSVLVAFRIGNEFHAIKNTMGVTTGRHLSYLSVLTDKREDLDEFKANFDRLAEQWGYLL